MRPPRVVTAPSPTAAAQTSKQQQEEVTVSIRVVLVRLVLGVLAPMLVVVAAFGIWNIQLQRETVNSNLLDTARSLALNIDRDLDTVQASLRTLALSANLQAGDLAAFHGQAIEAAKPFGGWIILVERGGRQLVNTRLPYGSTLPDVQLPQLTEHAFTTGEPQVSPLFIGGVTKKPVIAVSVPVFLNGKVAYDLRIGFLPERFAHLLSLAGKPAGWAAFLFDGERQIIGQWGPDEEKIGPSLGALLPPREGEGGESEGIYHPLDLGSESVAAYHHSLVSGWTILATAPIRLVDRPVTGAAAVFVGGAALSLLLAITAALLIGRRIASPLQALASHAEEVFGGKAIPTPGKTLAEIDNVQRALTKAGEIHRRHFQTQLDLDRETRARELAEYSRREIEKREKKARRLIDSNLIGIVLADEQRVIEANNVFLSMVGYTRAELDEGAVNWRAVTPPEHLPLGTRAVKWLQDQEEVAPFEKKFVRKDGSLVPVLVGAARIDSETPDLNWVCFVVDLTPQKQAAAELRQSEKRYRGLTEAISSVVWTAAANGAIVEMQHWSELTGQTQNQYQGYGWLDVLHPDDRETTRATWVQAMDNRQVLDVEYRVRNRNGRYRWYHARGAPVVDEDGSVREWIGICIDIDERKAAAARQLLLMAELDHRVRNILAAIQSMVSLTGAGVESKEEYAALLQGRIAAMARAHGLLSRQTWQGASLMEIIRDEIAPYVTSSDSVSVDGDPEFTLRPKDALDFALVIHELITNAAKYGALSVPAGRVRISWHEDQHTGMLVFTWQESSGPPVRRPDRRGFGSRLIANVFSSSIGRSARCDFLPDGLSCLLMMPLRSASLIRLRQDVPVGGASPEKPMPEGRILIVEDEPLIAMEMHRLISQAGLEVSGPVGTLDRALDLANDQTLTGAIIDINLGSEPSYPVADRLGENGVPVIFVTGYDAATMPARFAASPVLQKPIEPHVLLATLRRILPVAPAARPPQERADLA